MNECIFCKIASKKIKTEIIYESENFIAIPDTKPKCKGHTLIISKRHYANIIEMPDSLGNELIETIKKVAAIRINEGASGFNVLVNTGKEAGQVIMHVHVHILPRNSKCEVDFDI